ncbi:hypothetical protein D778_01595 [Xanthomarina gelatinilytica]|uniref:Uncharacterized protein n=1 Tax=Xanthomarina gelatinilytica TaxID=1137281 RepID=M7MLD8_9FLAO|nr:hypothetical protein [Xanthomarina gelatinilytica]EMQ95705.1 hypothetical protein D778_01595 [Xanthomarina gelatinilytica]
MKYLLNSFILIFISISSVAQNANNKEFKSANENVFVKSPFSNYYKIEKEAEFINELNVQIQKDHYQFLFHEHLVDFSSYIFSGFNQKQFNKSPVALQYQHRSLENPFIDSKDLIVPNWCLVIWEP